MTGTKPFRFDSPEFRRELSEHPHEAGEIAVLESILEPGDTVIEAGGNRGVTAVAISRMIGESGRLFVFEPVPEYYEGLVRNLARNGVSNAEAFRLALGADPGPVRFYKHGGGSGITPVDDAEELKVETMTVAGLMEARGPMRIDCLNLDCEGAELLVFRGAEAVLRGQGPQVFCEIHHDYLADLGQSAEEVAAFLGNLGYDVTPVDVEDLGGIVPLDRCTHIRARKREGRYPPRYGRSWTGRR